MKQKRNIKNGSVLVITLVIFGIIVVTSLSVTLVTLRNLKTSMQASKTNIAYQNADEGIDNVMTAILKGQKSYSSGNITVESITKTCSPALMPCVSNATCCPAGNSLDGKIVSGIDCTETAKREYEVEILDGADSPVRIKCYDTTKDISEIVQLKSSGNDNSVGTQRVVGANVEQKDLAIKLLLHMDSIVGTGTEAVDNSRVHHSVTNFNNVEIGVVGALPFTDSNYGYASFEESSNSYLKTSDVVGADWSTVGANGITPFTVDFWFKIDSSGIDDPQTMFYMKNGASDRLKISYVKASQTIQLIALGTTTCSYSESINSDWHHLAVVRILTTNDIKLYLDGESQSPIGPCSVAGDMNPTDIFIGSDGVAGTSDQYKGFIDELRVFAGQYWTANFNTSLPTSPY